MTVNSIASAQTDLRSKLSELVDALGSQLRDNGRFAISLAARQRGNLFVAPWRGRECFFTDGAGRAPLAMDDAHLQAFLGRHANGHLAYGYPVHVGADGLVSPLMFCEVTLLIDDAGSVAVAKARGRRPRLHHRAIAAAGYDASAIRRMVGEIEHASFASYRDCLTALEVALAIEDGVLQPEAIGHWGDATPAPGWHNVPILFAAPPNPIQSDLVRNINDLNGISLESLEASALHVLLSDRVPDGLKPGAAVDEPAAPVFTVSTQTRRVLRRVPAHPLVAVDIPPGGGQMALVMDLLASQALCGRSTLLVAAHRPVAEQVASRLQQALEPDTRWIVDLITDPEGKALRAHLGASDDSEAGQTPSGGDRPPNSDRVVDSPLLTELFERTAALERAEAAVADLAETLRLGALAASQRRETENRIHRPLRDLLSDPIRGQLDLEAIGEAANRARRLAAESPGERQRVEADGGGSAAERLAAIEREVQTVLGAIQPWAAATVSAWIAAAEPESPDTDMIAGRAARAAVLLEQLRHVRRWQSLEDDETTAFDAIARAEPSDRLVATIGQTSRDLAVSARQALAGAWRQRIDHDRKGAAHWADCAFDLQARRSAMRADESDDRALGRVIGNMSWHFPIWVGDPAAVNRSLPLEAALFDTVIVDDADALDAGALLPILLRARHAVVIGRSAGEQATGNNAAEDAFSLVAGASAATLLESRDHSRCHPQIAEFVSDAFYDGRLRILKPQSPLPDNLPTDMMGIRWYKPKPGSSGLDAECSGALSLIAGWRDVGVLAPRTGVSVGIVTPLPDRIGLLSQALPQILPDPAWGSRVAVGLPETFESSVVDLLIMLPGIEAGMAESRRASLADSRAMYLRAAAAARAGLHVVGDAEACRAAGGAVAQLIDHVTHDVPEADLAAIGRAAEPTLQGILRRVGLHHRHRPWGFVVTGRFGGRYALVLDAGADHVSEASGMVRFDIDPDGILETPKAALELIRRLV